MTKDHVTVSVEELEELEELWDDAFRLEYGEELAKTDFAIALVQARHRRKLTQAQLATILGVKQSHIARLESGYANPTIGKAGRVFAALWERFSASPEPLVRSGVVESPMTAAEMEAVGMETSTAIKTFDVLLCGQTTALDVSHSEIAAFSNQAGVDVPDRRGVMPPKWEDDSDLGAVEVFNATTGIASVPMLIARGDKPEQESRSRAGIAPRARMEVLSAV